MPQNHTKGTMRPLPAEKPIVSDSNGSSILLKEELDPKRLLENFLLDVPRTEAELTIILNSSSVDLPEEQDDTFDMLDSEDDSSKKMPSDIYLVLVIVSISLIVLTLLGYAIYKALVMLKVSLNDGRDDSVPVPPPPPPPATVSQNVSNVPNVQQRQQNDPNNRTNRTQPGMGQSHFNFLQGIRYFQAPVISSTLRSRASIKSEDDRPPPYEEQVQDESVHHQQSPPPYHVAIKMLGQESDVTGHEDDITAISEDETDSKRKKYVSVAVVV